MKKEARQLLVQMNEAKAKKCADIEEISAELCDIIGGSHKHLIDGDDEDEKEEDNVYMHPADMNHDE